MNLDVSETVRKDRHTGVNWVADLAADVFKSDVDCAAQLREAFAAAIGLEAGSLSNRK